MTPIFDESFLVPFLADFRLSGITNLRNTRLIISAFISEIESDKIDTLKEEEIKSRFITSFFGDVLGFNYGNSNEWQLREEKKAVVDGTKSDAALGYFYKDKKKDDVRAVIEIKDSNTNLDEPQNRKIPNTPVEQAFAYSHKMGGKCKWVIVSNLKEIRFYNSGDSSRFQSYSLNELTEESKLKELLFLFHKDRFIKKNSSSQTDLLFKRSMSVITKEAKPVHIIDKIDYCVKRFYVFGYIDPNYISTLYPFNILNEYVWHYSNGELFTINSEIFDLLSEISIVEAEIVFSEKLQKEIETEKIFNAKEKLKAAFIFLNYCQIWNITAIKDYQQIQERNSRSIGFSIRQSFNYKENEGVNTPILLVKNISCDCISCNYRNLNFNKLLAKINKSKGDEEYYTLEYGYGNYVVAANNYKSAYLIYKQIEKETKGIEGKEILYFLAKKNRKYLFNLILRSDEDNYNQILGDIKSIDLDKVIYDEIEFNVDKEVKEYLINVKEDELLYKLKDQIEESLFQIEKIKNLYDQNHLVRTSGANYVESLIFSYHQLYLYINRNYIIYDSFKLYKNLAFKFFNGLILSYQTKEIGLTQFNYFFLTEAILHIQTSDLQNLLKNVNGIKADAESIDKMIEGLNNFTTSYYKDGYFNTVYQNPILKEYLCNIRFERKFADIFSNLFTILAKLSITKEQFSKSISPLLKYLRIEKELHWDHLKEFANFVLEKGYLFEFKDLHEILRIAIYGDNYEFNKYFDLIKSTALALDKFHNVQKLDNVKLVKFAIIKSSEENGKNSNLKHLIHLTKVLDGDSKKKLLNAYYELLDKEYDSDLFLSLIEFGIFDWSVNDYFDKYILEVNKRTAGRKNASDNEKLTDWTFMQFANLIYKLEIEFNEERLRLVSKNNDFENWLLNPEVFDYNSFNAKWLIDIDNPIIMNRLRSISKIKILIDEEICKNYDPVLVQIRAKYFFD